MKSDIIFASEEAKKQFMEWLEADKARYEAEPEPLTPGFEKAVEAVAVLIAGDDLFAADCGGYGWDAETDDIDTFLPAARKKARRFLDAALPHL